ncbi:DEAD/DEAH box helicase [Sphingobacterium pedocola]|uniref:Helicase SNF2 n=1 Tax=Sphingobacterium pedocola TaxID=2082722 RepID=A0ABR9T3B3_9SPHI|nr:DEAD/DEAH box helicase [Sphingobacterium pedocola]MBE8719836.1 hypothetical protein [Sphingobacterium pedocola]
METTQTIASEKEATTTVLPKRKASEPFLIPWEDGEEFKLNPNFIASLYKAKSDLRKFRVWIRKFTYVNARKFNAQLSHHGAKAPNLDLELLPEGLSVCCSCKKIVAGICIHAASALYSKAEKDFFFFKNLYKEEVDCLPLEQQSFFNYHIDIWTHSPKAFYTNHTEHGRIFGYRNNYLGENIINEKIILSNQASALPNFSRPIFAVPTNLHFLGIPIIIPFLTDDSDNTKSRFSYLREENHEQTIQYNSEDVVLETLCKKILKLKSDCDNSLSIDGSTLKSFLVNQWRTSLHAKITELSFFTSSNYSFDINSFKLPAKYGVHKSTVTLAGNDLKIKFKIKEEEDGSLGLSLHLYYLEELIVAPIFGSNIYCYFLQLTDDHTLFIDDVDVEQVLQQFRLCKFKLTALKQDLINFFEEIVFPLSKRFEFAIEAISNSSSIKKMHEALMTKVTISAIEEYLCFDLSYFDKSSNEWPVASQANCMIYRRENVMYYYERAEVQLQHEEIINQHIRFQEQAFKSRLALPKVTIKRSNWLGNFIKSCRGKGIKVVINKVKKGSEYFPQELSWEVVKVIPENRFFSIYFKFKFGQKLYTTAEFENVVNDSPGIFPLDNGNYAFLKRSDKALFDPLYTHGIVEDDCIKLTSAQMLSFQTLLEKIDASIIQESLRERRAKLANLDEIPQLAIPETVQATLRPYQQAGFSWMAFLNEFQWGGILADDMGLGKTLQAITLLESFYEANSDAPPSLIVVPNTLLFNWQNEFQKFAPNRQISIYHGLKRKEQASLKNDVIIVTTYGTLIADAVFFRHQTFSYLIMDESQAVKNRNSKRFEILSEVQATFRIAMTGTPIENGIQDLYAQMSLVNPGFFGNYRNFNRMFKGVKDEEVGNEVRTSLKKMIEPFILRRTKKQVALDLPDKTEAILHIDMLPTQRKVYDKYRKLFRDEVRDSLESEEPSKSKFLAIEALIKLRQICNSPSLLKGEMFAKDAVKLDYIDEILEDVVPGHKVLLFSSFTGMLKLVAERIQVSGVQYAYLDGKLSQAQRQAAVEQFQNNENCRLFLISLKAGGTGLNLTAADYVYILDPWWNPAAEAQAIDRCYRIGQEKHVNAYKLVCRDSVEEKILALQERKKKLADGLILDETNIMKSLSKEELLKLFE